MDDSAQPITEHLAELRRRLAWILGTWAVAALASFRFAEEIFAFLLAPAIDVLGPSGSTLQSIAPAEIFFTYLKCALLSGFVFSLPVFFWQVWSFVAPGLYENEKKSIVPFVFFSTLLFSGGAIFGYSAVFPIVFEFFNSFSSDFVVSAWTMREVFSLTTRLFLAFGIAFEMPLFVFFLSLTRIVSARQLLAGTPYAVVGVFILAAVMTPPDFVSQLFLAFPMIALYLTGVGVAWIFDPTRRDQRRARTIAKRAEKDPGSSPVDGSSTD